MRTNLLTQLRSASVQIARSPSRRNASRRGVLLLVVLSMLVLFMLIGTAFLMSSSQEQKTAKHMSKDKRVGNFATKNLDRGLLQILRDTENPYSAVRYHSLLRDLYGTDGLLGVIYSPSKHGFDSTRRPSHAVLRRQLRITRGRQCGRSGTDQWSVHRYLCERKSVSIYRCRQCTNRLFGSVRCISQFTGFTKCFET